MLNRQPMDEYFAAKGIDVYFNPQALTDELVNQFVYETHQLVQATDHKRSMLIKPELYDTVLGTQLTRRPKYTGFEKLITDDIQFRRRAKTKLVDYRLIKIDRHASNGVQSTTAKTFKELLGIELQKIPNAMLLMSGGIDSEFLATTMLTTGVKFTPVIFQWTTVDGTCVNDHDTKWAFEFCTHQQLEPLVFSIDVQTLWNSDEFLEFVVSHVIVSSHIGTYYHMVEAITKLYPGQSILFGGEVRYQYGTVNNQLPINSVAFVSVNKATLPVLYRWTGIEGGGSSGSQPAIDSSQSINQSATYPGDGPGYYSFRGPKYSGQANIQITIIGGGGGGGGGESAGNDPYKRGGGGGGGGFVLQGGYRDYSGSQYSGRVGGGGGGGSISSNSGAGRGDSGGDTTISMTGGITPKGQPSATKPTTDGSYTANGGSGGGGGQWAPWGGWGGGEGYVNGSLVAIGGGHADIAVTNSGGGGGGTFYQHAVYPNAPGGSAIYGGGTSTANGGKGANGGSMTAPTTSLTYAFSPGGGGGGGSGGSGGSGGIGISSNTSSTNNWGGTPGGRSAGYGSVHGAGGGGGGFNQPGAAGAYGFMSIIMYN